MSRIKVALAALSLVGLFIGLLAPWLTIEVWRPAIWAAAAGIVLAALLSQIVSTLRRGEFGLDIIAALSMGTALLFGEMLAAAVVALMYAGGQLLEDYAQARARSEMHALLGRAPKRALRYLDGQLREVPAEELVPGDRVLVRQGEIVPADGVVESGTALLDHSVVTGESVPVLRRQGEAVLSGTSSLDMAFDMVVTKPAAESTYAGIVRLVAAAQEAKAPMVRLADRYAMWFLLVTVALATLAWAASGDHLRALAVLVVATPCPLILAVPVAIVSGISKAARRGVLIKGGPVLEVLAGAQTLVIDKTGTLTGGKASLSEIVTRGRWTADEMLRLAASLDLASSHVIAASIVEAARERGLKLSRPVRAREIPGKGISGLVDGQRVAVGGGGFVAQAMKLRRIVEPHGPPGSVQVAVGIGGKLAGFLILADEVREDAAKALRELRNAGISRVVLASGDQRSVVEKVGKSLGIDELRSELDPKGKIDVVLAERQRGPVLMVGDGVNDAPALAAADVGISLGVRGSSASAEAADAVLLVDRLDRLAEALVISRQSKRIALESVYAGLGLSLAGMIAASLGYLTPVQGALLQEVIDVAVIANALRALR
jgi:heavy metal translocating P-type ATPase